MSARSSMTSTGRSSLPRERPAREVNAANKKLVFEHFQFSGGALPFSYCHFPERRSTGLPNSKLAVTFLKKVSHASSHVLGTMGRIRIVLQPDLKCRQGSWCHRAKNLCLLMYKVLFDFYFCLPPDHKRYKKPEKSLDLSKFIIREVTNWPLSPLD